MREEWRDELVPDGFQQLAQLMGGMEPYMMPRAYSLKRGNRVDLVKPTNCRTNWWLPVSPSSLRHSPPKPATAIGRG